VDYHTTGTVQKGREASNGDAERTFFKMGIPKLGQTFFVRKAGVLIRIDLAPSLLSI
jgi:hypothetical protein